MKWVSFPVLTITQLEAFLLFENSGFKMFASRVMPVLREFAFCVQEASQEALLLFRFLSPVG